MPHDARSSKGGCRLDVLARVREVPKNWRKKCLAGLNSAERGRYSPIRPKLALGLQSVLKARFGFEGSQKKIFSGRVDACSPEFLERKKIPVFCARRSEIPGRNFLLDRASDSVDGANFVAGWIRQSVDLPFLSVFPEFIANRSGADAQFICCGLLIVVCLR